MKRLCIYRLAAFWLCIPIVGCAFVIATYGMMAYTLYDPNSVDYCLHYTNQTCAQICGCQVVNDTCNPRAPNTSSNYCDNLFHYYQKIMLFISCVGGALILIFVINIMMIFFIYWYGDDNNRTSLVFDTHQDFTKLLK